MIFFILGLAIFFALNMGGASFAASFATAYGGGVLSQKKAGLLFIIFVILGSITFGSGVAVTLGKNLLPTAFMTPKAVILIFMAAGISMFVANLTKIPQSTSLVTVAAIVGVGAFYGELQIKVLLFLFAFWIALPLVSYFLTHYIAGFIYPPRKANFWIYEKLINHRDKLKKFVIVSSCYSAFSVGTNNVANVAGPLMGNTEVSLTTLLFFFAFIYGTGSFVFIQPLKTAGERFVPLGLMTASIISIVSGSLMIIASSMGVPQSFVMLQVGAIFAIASLKEGPDIAFANPVTRNTFYTWTINPLLTFFATYGLSWLVLK